MKSSLERTAMAKDEPYDLLCQHKVSPLRRDGLFLFGRWVKLRPLRGRNSVGRMPASQAGRHGFESRRPLFRSLEVPNTSGRRVPNGSRRFFLGTRWGIDFRRQARPLLGRERRQQSIEIDGRLRTVRLWLCAEPELAPN